MLHTTLQQFKKATEKEDSGNKTRQGSNMTRVYDALQEYWDPNRLTEEGTATLAVLEACRFWLKKKKTKSDYQKKRIGVGYTNYYNTLFTSRRAAIANLARECLQNLMEVAEPTDVEKASYR